MPFNFLECAEDGGIFAKSSSRLRECAISKPPIIRRAAIGKYSNGTSTIANSKSDGIICCSGCLGSTCGPDDQFEGCCVRRHHGHETSRGWHWGSDRSDNGHYPDADQVEQQEEGLGTSEDSTAASDGHDSIREGKCGTNRQDMLRGPGRMYCSRHSLRSRRR